MSTISTTNQPNQLNVTPTCRPRRKVVSGGVAGAVVTLTVFLLNAYVFTGDNADKKIPPEITGAATTVLSFVIAYLVPPDPNETLIREDGQTKSALKE